MEYVKDLINFLSLIAKSLYFVSTFNYSRTSIDLHRLSKFDEIVQRMLSLIDTLYPLYLESLPLQLEFLAQILTNILAPNKRGMRK